MEKREEKKPFEAFTVKKKTKKTTNTQEGKEKQSFQGIFPPRADSKIQLHLLVHSKNIC
jgi:hypothetical protein